MKIESITGVGEKRLKAYKPISDLLITKDGHIADEKIEIYRVDGNRGGNETVCPRTELKELFEIAAQGEGMYVDSDVLSSGLIAVGMDGCASLTSSRYLEIELSSLVAGSNYEVFGMEDGEIVERVMVYHPIQINRDIETKEYENEGKELLALPFTGLDKVELVDHSGLSSTYTVQELKAKMRKENEVCCDYEDAAAPKTYFGFRDMAVISVVDVKTIKIYKDAATAYQLIFIDQA